MFEGLAEVQDLLERFGGHPMAAGLSLAEGKVDELRKRLNENARKKLTEDSFVEKIWIDVAMPFEYVTEALIQELSLWSLLARETSAPVCPEAFKDPLR